MYDKYELVVGEEEVDLASLEKADQRFVSVHASVLKEFSEDLNKKRKSEHSFHPSPKHID